MLFSKPTNEVVHRHPLLRAGRRPSAGRFDPCMPSAISAIALNPSQPYVPKPPIKKAPTPLENALPGIGAKTEEFHLSRSRTQSAPRPICCDMFTKRVVLDDVFRYLEYGGVEMIVVDRELEERRWCDWTDKGGLTLR